MLRLAENSLEKVWIYIGSALKIFETLFSWRDNSTEKNALAIQDLPEIDKTYIARKYCENQIYINFKNSDDSKTV